LWGAEAGTCHSGDARQFYQQLAAPVLIGMEATGNSQWFIELVEDLGHEIWIGDAARRGAQVSRTTLLDAAHERWVSGRSFASRQLGAAPDRRKLDRRC
jgi:hypothetical protein